MSTDITLSREKYLSIIRGLMTSEHLGDVRREIDELAFHAGIVLEGNYDDWTDSDWEEVGG